MWREFIDSLGADHTFHPPASPDELAQVEKALDVALPKELTELLSETNGLTANVGVSVILPTSRIIELNLEFRSLPDFRELLMPFDHLLFFGDHGNGDQYAYAILAGKIRRPDIFLWEHEDDTRRWYAANLKEYLEIQLEE